MERHRVCKVQLDNQDWWLSLVFITEVLPDIEVKKKKLFVHKYTQTWKKMKRSILMVIIKSGFLNFP